MSSDVIVTFLQHHEGVTWTGHWLTDAMITRCRHLTNVHTYCCHKLDPVHTSKSQSPPSPANSARLRQNWALNQFYYLHTGHMPGCCLLPQARVQVINAKPIFIASNNNKTHSQLLHTTRIARALGEQLLPSPLILREEGGRWCPVQHPLMLDVRKL